MSVIGIVGRQIFPNHLFLDLKLIFFLCCIAVCSVEGFAQEKGIPFYNDVFDKFPKYESKGFVFPVGEQSFKGYYNAKEFKDDNHLGEDWNGTGGGNTDLGDTIYSTSSGFVRFARDTGIRSWGNVIRIIHKYKGKYYESVYAHCDTITVKENTMISIGRKVGTIGTANGSYPAHLHFELRDDVTMGLGYGYSEEDAGYMHPTQFIQRNAYENPSAQ